MRTFVLFTSAALLLGGTYVGAQTRTLAQAQPKPAPPSVAQPATPPAPPEDPAAPGKAAIPRPAPPQTGEQPATKASDPAKTAQPALPKPSETKKSPEAEKSGEKHAAKMEKAAGPKALSAAEQADEQAIRQLAESYAKAYHEGNAKAAAAHFTSDAEYVDEDGNVSQGREEIEACLTDFFGDHPTCKLEFAIETIRFVAPGVAVEDGTTTIVHTEDGGPVKSRYTAVHLKQADGKWLTASVRDQANKQHPQHAEKLRELDWLIGDWIDEGDDSTVMFSCQPVDGGNYLERKFTVHIEGQERMSGTQRIGWDPASGKFRVWLFDSEGGYADGTIRDDGDQWILRMSGITSEGETAQGTSIYTRINDHTMTWQNVEHEVGGHRLPDSDEVTIVRQAPKPRIAEQADSLPAAPRGE